MRLTNARTLASRPLSCLHSLGAFLNFHHWRFNVKSIHLSNAGNYFFSAHYVPIISTSLRVILWYVPHYSPLFQHCHLAKIVHCVEVARPSQFFFSSFSHPLLKPFAMMIICDNNQYWWVIDLILKLISRQGTWHMKISHSDINIVHCPCSVCWNNQGTVWACTMRIIVILFILLSLSF